MRRLAVILAFLTLPGLNLAARANTITAGTYTLQNAFVSGYSVTGTVAVTSSGSVTSSNLTFNDAAVGNPSAPYFNLVSSTSAYNGLSQSYLSNSANSGQISFFFNTSTNTQGNFDLCLTGTQCGTASGTVDPSAIQIYGFYNSSTSTSNPGLSSTNFSSGYLSSSSTPAIIATPEPASFLMLGSGLVGLVGSTSRRLRHL